MKRVLPIALVVLLAAVVASCSWSDRRAYSTLSIIGLGGDFEQAKQMLRLDDYRQFEKAEVHFLMLRVQNRDDVELAGWFAQLYVAWAEQLQSELLLLKRKLAAAEKSADTATQTAVFGLIDFRQAQLTEVLDSARSLCHVLVSYNGDAYISHRVMADYYRLMGDREAMDKELAVVKRKNAKSIGLLFIQGAAAAQFDGDYPTAIGWYDKALERDPMFLKALYFKGLAQSKLGFAAEARATMEAVLEKSPDHPGAQRFLSVDAYLIQVEQEALAMAAEKDSTALSDDWPRLIMATLEQQNGLWHAHCRVKGSRAQGQSVLAVSELSGDQVLHRTAESFSLEVGRFESFDIALKSTTPLPAGLELLVQLTHQSPDAAAPRTLAIQRLLPQAPSAD